MKLSGFSKFVEPFYADRLSIRRRVAIEDPRDHTKKVTLSKEPILTNIPCRISFTREDSPNMETESLNPIHLQIKIFCGVGVDIQKGDDLTAYRMAEDGTTVLETYTGTANLPLVYPTHKEVLFTRGGNA